MSWNNLYTLGASLKFRRPPCEVVSWNLSGRKVGNHCISSTSLWGRELKFPLFRRYLLGFRVDLLVRSWVEISKVPFLNFFLRVDLLVRSWVEISIIEECYDFDRSTSLWGRELKCKRWLISKRQHGSTSLWGRELKWKTNGKNFHMQCRPPCEVVSWNKVYKK